MTSIQLTPHPVSCIERPIRVMANPSRLRPLVAAALSLCTSVAFSQTGSIYREPSVTPSVGPAPQLFKGSSAGGVDYSVNAAVGSLVVEVSQDGLPADGVTPNRITLRLFAADGKPLTGRAVATVEASAGRILLSGAKTDELGPGGRDRDRVVPGTQIEVTDGVATFTLLAPSQPQDVQVRVTAGAAVAQGVIAYVPHAREFVAAGLLEGIISEKRDLQTNGVRIDDAFERELRRWTRSTSDGRGFYGVRSAFFVKGKLQNDWIVSSSFDSDKPTRGRQFRDVRTDTGYTVFGDASLRGTEAQSSGNLFLRFDKERDHVLYGDFNTGAGFTQLGGGGATASVQARNLGNYSRSMLGLKAHGESRNYFANVWASSDSLKQVVEEYRGNGTSGPFRVRLNSGIENSEKVEVITRDRNQLGVVLDVKALSRFDDYAFEPFSGAVLLKSPVATVDANGNPMYLRITYEVDQGGEKFTTAGIDGQVRLGESFEVGGSYVKDANPLSPYTLASANFGLGLGKNTRIVAEVASAESTRYLSGGSLLTTPSGAAGELRNDRKGDAWRVEAKHADGAFSAGVWAMSSDPSFYNPAASISEGKAEAGLKASLGIGAGLSVYGEASVNGNKAVMNNPKREAAALGLKWKSGPSLELDASIRRTSEDSGFVGNSTLTTTSGAGGGFFGQGTDAVNPSTGTTIAGNLSNGGTTSAPPVNAANISSSTLRLAANWIPAESWGVQGEIEGGSGSQNRAAVRVSYQINERAKGFARYETQRGLTSAAALNPADRSQAFTAGVESSFLQSGTMFSEYRLRDALSQSVGTTRDMQLATGARNTWHVDKGLAITANAEHLKVLQGGVRDAMALGLGGDYTASEWWQFSGRLEYKKLFDDRNTAGDQSEQQWMSTLSAARKLNRSWTLLARNYLLLTDYADKGDRIQDRFQVGFAYRPVDNNRWNALGRYEYKMEKDQSSPTGEDYRAHIVSLHANHHPSRPWWFSGRLAMKSSTDNNLLRDQTYNAWLVGGRATYDFSENWDIGVMASMMGSPTGNAKQHAAGLEVGYLVRQDLWLSLGANWTGFSDRDLTAGEYTNRGVYLRLRFKFDENLLRGDNKTVNRSLNR